MSEIFPGVKQISQTGNEMYGQGGFPVGIHTTDAGWLADPADTMLLAGRDPVIKEVSVGMTGEEAAVYDVSGTPPLTLPNSLGKPLKAWEVDVLPYQEGTGDPSPDNVRPIHGTDKVKVFVRGVNLWDSNIDTSKIVLVNTSSGTQRVAYPLGLKGCTLTFSATAVDASVVTSLFINIATYKNGVATVLNSFLTPSGVNQRTFTFADDEEAIIIAASTVAFELAYNLSKYNIQIEFGSTATDYEPYQGNTYTITLPQTVYTGTIGSDGGESRDVSVVYNGSNMQWATGFGGFITDQSLVTGYNNPDAVPNLLCDIYPVMPYYQATQSARAMSVIYGGEGYTYNGRIVVRDNTISSLSEFTAQLTGHQIVYRSTSTQFPLTAPTIPTPTGTATTWATAEDGTVESMEVTYVGKS